MSEKSIDLSALGISEDDIRDRIVERAAEDLLHRHHPETRNTLYDDLEGRISSEVEGVIKTQIDDAVAKIVEAQLGKNLEDYLADLTFQGTNKWGEPKGERLTLREYLLDRAENYLSEKVNHSGESKNESNSYNWKAEQSRIEYWVYSQLHSQIENAVKSTVGEAHKILQASIEDTIRVRLAAISKAIKVEVKP